MPPCALLTVANRSVFDAIRIAKVFAGERGGIATFPEVVRASLDRPNEAVFKNLQVLTSSVIAFGRDKGGLYRACISHSSGLMEDEVGLQAAYQRAIALTPKTQTPFGGPNYGHLDSKRFQELLADGQSSPIRATCKPPTQRQLRTEVNTLDLLKGQMRALLGPDFARLIERRRQQHPYPTNGSAYDKRVWRRGNIGGSCFHDGQVSVTEFQDGKHCLMTPLVFMQNEERNKPSGSPPKMSAISWPYRPIRVLAWRDRAEQSGEIFEDPLDLATWKLGRASCLHPNDEPLPASPLPYFVGNISGAPEETLVACKASQDAQGNVGGDPDPMCRVHATILGDCILEKVVVDMPLTQAHWRTLVSRAPSGTQGFHMRIDLAEIKENCTPWGHIPLVEKLRVEFVSITPVEPRRYLTGEEMISDPHAYLRLIGATS